MKYLRNPYFVAGIIFLAMWYAARLPLWNSHLQVDVWISWLRVSYFFEHGRTFAGMTGNEILPATLLYILAPLWLIPVDSINYQTYLAATLVLNLIPLGLSWYWAKNKKVILSILLFLGPILLFRFDGMVTLLVVTSFLAYAAESYLLTGWLIGIATGMKVFPIIFVPYLLLLLIRKKAYREVGSLILSFLIALGLPVLVFELLGGNYEQLRSALMFHSQKLISIESVVGSLITGWSLITKHIPPPLLPGNGIWSVPGPNELMNKVWLIPIAVLYLRMIIKPRRYLAKFDWQIPLTLTLVFLVVSKNLNPQYVWWFLILMPYTKLTIGAWSLALIVAITNQLVYPLFYTTFTDAFYRLNSSYWIYYVLLIRNLAIVILTWQGVVKFWQQNNRIGIHE